jgi:hypothetical protein
MHRDSFIQYSFSFVKRVRRSVIRVFRVFGKKRINRRRFPCSQRLILPSLVFLPSSRVLYKSTPVTRKGKKLPLGAQHEFCETWLGLLRPFMSCTALYCTALHCTVLS